MTIEEITKQGKNKIDIDSYLLKSQRKIYLTGEITDEKVMDIIKQIDYLTENSQEDIIMIINSPGGSINAGLALYDIMQKSSCDIITICLGTAASMGAFLLAAGTKGKRYAYMHSEIMIHQIIGSMNGQATEMEIQYNRISKIKNIINDLLHKHTEQPIEKIQIDTERDYYMSSYEAKEYGIIDVVIE